MLPQTFDPITFAAFVGGFMAIIAYFKPRVGLLLHEFFCPPQKAEMAPTSSTILTSLNKRQVQLTKLNEWSELNAWSIKMALLSESKQMKRRVRQNNVDKAMQDLIGQNPQVTTAVTQRIRVCAETSTFSTGELAPFAADILSCCRWTEDKRPDPIQLLVVFVGAVWNPACRHIVLDLKAVREQFKDTQGIAFVFAPINSGTA